MIKQYNLKPCPFCGSDDIVVFESSDSCGRNTTYTVECYTCDPFFNTEQKAVDFWNKRVEIIEKKVRI
jgi:Lar family restriction alleviation protein